MELNGLAVRLQEECNPETCTQMTATEQWIFLCAAHKTPKEVSVISIRASYSSYFQTVVLWCNMNLLMNRAHCGDHN